MPPFEIKSEFRPAGDQPEAIERLIAAVRAGEPHTTLLGATGTGQDVHDRARRGAAAAARPW